MEKRSYAEVVTGIKHEEVWSPGDFILNPSSAGFGYHSIYETKSKSEVDKPHSRSGPRRSPRKHDKNKRSALLRLQQNIEADLEEWTKNMLQEDENIVDLTMPSPKKSSSIKSIVINSDDSLSPPKKMKVFSLSHDKPIVINSDDSLSPPKKMKVSLPSYDTEVNIKDESYSHSIWGKRNLSNEINEEYNDEPKLYFMDDPTLPIFKKGLQTGIFTKPIVQELLLSKGSLYLAKRVPLCVNINALFLIDTSALGHPKDVLADGCGVWQQTKTKVQFFRLRETILQEIEDDEYGEKNTFKVSRLSYRHADSKDFHRIILFIKMYNQYGEEVHHKAAAMQYYFEGIEHPVHPRPHGNSKNTSKIYNRTFESVKTQIKEEIDKKCKPKDIVHNILNAKGGIHEIKAPGEHARNRKQVTNFKFMKKEDKQEDPLLELMDICKTQSLSHETAYVREVTASPEMTVFLATKQQLVDVERFCTNTSQFSILGVDSTFNIGNYYLTLTTYRNLMLSTNKKVHPVFIGPALIHQRRLFDSYFMLPSSMIKWNPKLKGLLVFGSDGEKNISDTFGSCFTNAKHLLCDIHLKDNIQKKLSDLNIKGDIAKEYLNDIFGKQIRSQKIQGLVDCLSYRIPKCCKYPYIKISIYSVSLNIHKQMYVFQLCDGYVFTL